MCTLYGAPCQEFAAPPVLEASSAAINDSHTSCCYRHCKAIGKIFCLVCTRFWPKSAFHVFVRLGSWMMASQDAQYAQDSLKGLWRSMTYPGVQACMYFIRHVSIVLLRPKADIASFDNACICCNWCTAHGDHPSSRDLGHGVVCDVMPHKLYIQSGVPYILSTTIQV